MVNDKLGPARRALIAFVFHGFGVHWLLKEPLGPALLRDNALALGATVLAVLAALRFAPNGGTREWAFVAFLIGHFGWGTYLAVRISLRARSRSALTSLPRRPRPVL